MGIEDRYVGVDLGGTKILAGVVTPAGEILSRSKRPTPFKGGGRRLLASLSETITEALGQARVPPERVIAIGLGSPGPLDPEKGIVLRTPNIAVKRFPVGPLLSKRFGVPVVLDNDVHMAVYGEWVAGAARGYRHVIGLWVGTGVGGCVIWDGRVVSGVNRNAGEIGHMILDARKARPGKGKGTLEWEASRTGIERMLAKGLRRGRRSKLARSLAGNRGRLKSGDLAKAYRAGDKAVVAAVEHSGRYLGLAVSNLFDALAPELFLLGGGVAGALGKPYLALVRESADAHAYSTELGKIRIALSRLEDDAGLLGAALAARERYPAGP
jgi:glucokinase